MNKETFYKHAAPLGIGDTPLIPYEEDLAAEVFIKNEAMNGSGSVKDRAALMMILDAEERGLLHKGDTIVEATSGNMGIALAYVGVSRGYKVKLAMPETMTKERRELLKGVGAELALTDGALGMQGAVDCVEQMSKQPNTVWLKQFCNQANALAHYLSTAEEIIADLDKVDIFVAGVGTGGTLCGTGKRLKEVFKNVKIVAVEPASSPMLSRGEKGKHAIQGIGAGFVPEVYDGSVVDDIQVVTNEEALDKFAQLNKCQGYSCGISAAANIVVAERLAALPQNKGKNIVTVFPDGDDRYVSLLNKQI